MILLILAGCAEVGPPPGGEVDQKGPSLLESFPASGALGVATDSEVTLVFSETLVKPDKGVSVFVSPRPKEAPEVEWKGNRVRIRFEEPLLPDRTYVVSVNSELADLRRNRMDSAVTVAFATGQTIDTGVVAGKVLGQDGKPAVGWAVGLYPLGTFETYAFADSTYPTYLTTTGRDGSFTLPYLPSGAHNLIAFDDVKRDDLFNPAVEPFALPDRYVLIGGELPLGRLVLSAAMTDSLARDIVSVVPTGDGLVQVRLSGSIVPSYLNEHFDQTTLRFQSDSAIGEFRCAGFLESDVEQTGVLTGFFAELPDSLYRISLVYAADRPPLLRDSVAIKRPPDKTPPKVVRFTPGDKPQFVNQVKIELVFSEPIDRAGLREQSLVLWEDSVNVVNISQVWSDAFHLNLMPQRLDGGSNYRIDLTEFDFRDLAGNPLGDSLCSWRFATLDADSVGSVSGQIVVDISDRAGETAILSFVNTASKAGFRVEVDPLLTGNAFIPRPFSLDVPPGKYLVSGFLDSDSNGTFTPGSISPYRRAETQAFYADTVAVRARFETAGVEFRFE